eukprot:3861848-Rhodomonas_salina.1
MNTDSTAVYVALSVAKSCPFRVHAMVNAPASCGGSTTATVVEDTTENAAASKPPAVNLTPASNRIPVTTTVVRSLAAPKEGSILLILQSS